MGRYVIMPGDPKRCKETAKHFDNARSVADSREYIIYTGCLGGEKVSIILTGIGGLFAPIASGELVLCGTDAFIRVGTCGGMGMDVKGGGIVVAMGTIHMKRTSKECVPIEYPVVTDLGAINTLILAVKALGYTYHIGVVECKDIFYGQHKPERMPVSYELLDKWEAWGRMGCKAPEMKFAALFIATSHPRVRYGSGFLVVGNRERQNTGLGNPIVYDTEATIKAAVEAIRRLIREDGS